MYIKYVDDPVKRRVNSAFGSLCDGEPIKNTLQLINNCFSVFDREKLLASFCDFKNFGFPVDGYSLVDLTVCGDGTEVLFDNSLQSIVAVNNAYPLDENKAYARGILMVIQYPAGTSIFPSSYTSTLTFYDRPATGTFDLPVGEAFSYFANPDATTADKILNKLEITNTNANFSIKVKGLILFSKTNPDPNSFC
jgi:hypothetical protein